MSHHDSAEISRNSKPSRRRVVSAAAWSAPVIAAAGVAPFSAASTPAGLTVGWTSQYSENLLQTDIDARALSLGIAANVRLLNSTWPQTFTFTNTTTSDYTGQLSATFQLDPSSGINVDLLGTSDITVKAVAGTGGDTGTYTVSAPTATGAGGTGVTVDLGEQTIAANGGTLTFAITFGYTGTAVLSLALLATYVAKISAIATAPTVVTSGANAEIRHYLAADAILPAVLTAP
ncbi:hypothetical protein [Neomicrococcus aestuarii]|uniref:Uncharacterized protein n=1 Tax=Neomicrococcus aestuarii TaxID=556325 RepID=A0A1L2ZP74_9MICC|nr:hypothetical protein [Neomicrococcus aestuarii]APF40970.1 hypothetical protein BHE16_08080 [Neomicrococcus aestuarii]